MAKPLRNSAANAATPSDLDETTSVYFLGMDTCFLLQGHDIMIAERLDAFQNYRKKVCRMKRILLLILALLLCLSLCACDIALGNEQTQPSETHQHNYTSIVTPPTCTRNGYTTYTCDCGDGYTADHVDKLGHNYQEIARVDATSHQDGSVTYLCSSCDDRLNEVLYATGSEGLQYYDNGDGTCTLVGIGICSDLNVMIPRFYKGALVTGIGEGAFRDCSSVTDVTIPDSVTGIGASAFSGCCNLGTHLCQCG